MKLTSEAEITLRWHIELLKAILDSQANLSVEDKHKIEVLEGETFADLHTVQIAMKHLANFPDEGTKEGNMKIINYLAKSIKHSRYAAQSLNDFEQFDFSGFATAMIEPKMKKDIELLNQLQVMTQTTYFDNIRVDENGTFTD